MNYYTKITQHPLLIPFLIWMTLLIVLMLLIVIRVPLHLSVNSQLVIADITVLAIGARLLTYFGWWKRIGFWNAGSLKDIPLFIPLILLVLFLYSGNSVNITGYSYFFILALAILVGFTEEIFFPGPPPGITLTGGDPEGGPPVSGSFWTPAFIKSGQWDMGSFLRHLSYALCDGNRCVFCSATGQDRNHLATYRNSHPDRL